ncbi:MAG: hypothetical protein ACOCXT_04495 [Candidatus Dojkabacteria bacterium]
MDKYKEQIKSFVECIDFLIYKKHDIPALNLIYSLIDHLAYLDSAEGCKNVTRSDYKNWCVEYLDLSKLEVDAIDLYSARCALLHTGMTESDLSRQNKASLLFYIWGDKSKEGMEQKYKNEDGSWKVKKFNEQSYKFIKVEALFEQVKNGIETFQKKIENDEDKKTIVKKKAVSYPVNTS